MPHLVTCVLPAYNHEAYVVEAVQSVLAPHNQGLVEVIAIDDASTDRTYERLATLDLPGLTVLRNPRNLGLVETLRRGFAEAKAPYLTALASDDRWLPNRLAVQLDALESGACWSFGRAHVIDGAGVRTSAEPQGYTPGPEGVLSMLLRGQAIYAPTLMYQRHLLDRVGGVLDALWEDLAISLRFAAVADPVFHEDPLVEYRVHDSNAHLGLVAARRHFTAHAEAVALLHGWPELPPALAGAVEDHAAVWDWLARWATGSGRLIELRGLPRDALDGVLGRQAAALVRDLTRGQLHRLEVALRLAGAQGAASELADLLGNGPVWSRVRRKVLRR